MAAAISRCGVTSACCAAPFTGDGGSSVSAQSANGSAAASRARRARPTNADRSSWSAPSACPSASGSAAPNARRIDSAWSRRRTDAAFGLRAGSGSVLLGTPRKLISLPQERAWVRALLARRPAVRWDRLLFSAKESVYKAWYPLTGRWLDFEEAVITLDLRAGTFRAGLLVPGPEVDGVRLTGFDGRWRAGAGLVVTAVAVRPVPRERSASLLHRAPAHTTADAGG
ncbi:4'-phosphopantetheinyl transferase family protein [Streptomyces sp. NPDC001514]